MLNKLFRNNGWVVSVGKGLGSVLFPCPPANQFLRTDTQQNGVSWWGCGNYGWNVINSVTYDIYTDGNCGEVAQMTGSYHAEAGHVFYDTGCCQVIYDGGTSYYVNDNCNPCSGSGNPTGNTSQTNIETLYWFGCETTGTFDYAYDIQEEFHDGNCSTYWMTTSHYEATNGQRIWENECCHVDYDYRGSYSVFDNCGEPPPPPPCDSSGTVVDSGSGNYSLNWDGCGNSGSWDYGYYSYITYADGNCSTYTQGYGWTAPSGTEIYGNGCCSVYFDGSNGTYVIDTCNPPEPCTEGFTSDFQYRAYEIYIPELNGTYPIGQVPQQGYIGNNCAFSWQDSGPVEFYTYGTWIAYDGNCCNFFSQGDGYYYTECSGCEPPPPDYPPEGTVLNSGSEEIITFIEYSGLDFETESFNTGNENAVIGNSYWTEIADGQGGSTTSGGSNYLSDGSTIFQSLYGAIHNIEWYVSDEGGTYSGIQKVGLDVPSWVMAGEGIALAPTPTFIDKLSSGYIIFETNSWFNGEANVKTRVEYTGGTGWITTTITF